MISETLVANLSVLMLSMCEEPSGATCMNIMTFACPDRLSASSCVSLLLRKGTWLFLEARAAITSPRADREVLMCLASVRRSPEGGAGQAVAGLGQVDTWEGGGPHTQTHHHSHPHTVWDTLSHTSFNASVANS